MAGEQKCTEIGCMTPAQVVACADRENTECWIAATTIAQDGSEVTYECCGGAGRKARFSLLRHGETAQSVSASQVPDSLTWVHRTVI